MTKQNVATEEVRGRDLLYLRRQAGITADELLAALGWRNVDRHKLASIENEKVLPLPQDVKLIQEAVARIVDERMAGVGA